MTQYANGFEPDRYLARSWALLTRDHGWVKPVLVLALVSLVPIIGPIAALGYALEWARLTAWGVDSAPKQRRVNVGQVIASGWRGTVVEIVWLGVAWLAFALVYWLLGLIPGERMSFVPGLLEAIYVVATVILSLVVDVAQIRSAVYQRMGTGLRADRVLEMVRRDFGGLLRMVGMLALELVVQLVAAMVLGILAGAIVVPYAVSFGSGTMLLGRYALISMLTSLFSSLAPLAVIALFVMSAIAVTFHLLVYTGVGLWMRQFDVPSWGRSADPLPSDVRQQTDEPPVEPHSWGPDEQQPEQRDGYQVGAYRPDQPGDEGQAGAVPSSDASASADASQDDAGEEHVEHLL